MVDKRPFAKIDTGYALNPKWFQVERAIRQHLVERPVERLVEQGVQRTVIRNAVRTAREAHLFSILYSAQNVTDGMFPVDVIKSLAVVQTDDEEAAITALFDVGLWINHPGGMAEVRDYLEHQTSSEKVKKASEDARNAGKISAEKRKADSTTRSTTRSTEEKRREEKEVARADVLEILDYLDSKLLTLDVKLPNRNKTNLQEARRLLDVDHKTVTQVKACIDYAMDDPFWSTTCLSIKSLRKSYDRISLQARGKQNTRQAVPALVRAGDLDD